MSEARGQGCRSADVFEDLRPRGAASRLWARAGAGRHRSRQGPSRLRHHNACAGSRAGQPRRRARARAPSRGELRPAASRRAHPERARIRAGRPGGRQNRLVRKTPLSRRHRPVTVSGAVSRLVTGRKLGLLGREPSFRSLFLATLGSGLGTWLALVALQIDVLRRTHSPIWMSALLIANILPTLVVGLLAGPLVDRLSRRALMIGADLTRFGVFCALPLAPNATTIVGLAVVSGVATGFFRPSVYAGLPNLVSDRDLPRANSLLQVIDNSTWAIGSLIGGALVAARGPHLAYWINAATFLISAALIAQIGQRRLQEAKAETRGHWRDPAGGFGLVRSSRGLVTVFIAWNVGMVANAFVNVGEPFLAIDTFSAGSFGLGLLMGSAAVGLAGGAFLAGSWIEERGLPNVYGASLGLMALGVAGAAGS